MKKGKQFLKPGVRCTLPAPMITQVKPAVLACYTRLAMYLEQANVSIKLVNYEELKNFHQTLVSPLPGMQKSLYPVLTSYMSIIHE